MVGGEDGLDAQQEVVPPEAEVLAVLRVQRVGAVAADEVAAEVEVAVGAPGGVGGREVGDTEAFADAAEHVVELMLLVGGQRARVGLVSALGFIFKICVFLFIYIWLRGTLPRFRFDQLMSFGWKILLPLALLNIFLTATVIFFFPNF